MQIQKIAARCCTGAVKAVIRKSKKLKGGTKTNSPVIDSLQDRRIKIGEEKGCDDAPVLNTFPAPDDTYRMVTHVEPKWGLVQVPSLNKYC